MQPVALPVYLLIDDQEQGPFEEPEIDEMLADGRITPAHYGFCEGMPGWRSVLEACIWARAPLFHHRRPEIQHGVGEVLDGRRSDRDVVSDLVALLRTDGIQADMGWPERMEALSAVVSVNLGLRQGYRQWSQGSDFSVLDAYPAVELYEQIESPIPRDWRAVWTEAGGRVYGERMLALKTDPVWAALSDFGVPYPVYSVAGEMWVRPVSRTDVEALGMLDPETGLDLLLPSAPPWVLLGES